MYGRQAHRNIESRGSAAVSSTSLRCLQNPVECNSHVVQDQIDCIDHVVDDEDKERLPSAVELNPEGPQRGAYREFPMDTLLPL